MLRRDSQVLRRITEGRCYNATDTWKSLSMPGASSVWFMFVIRLLILVKKKNRMMMMTMTVMREKMLSEGCQKD